MIQGFSSGLIGNRELMYETDLPSFQRDFASVKTLDHGTGPAIAFTRASNATFFDVNGVLQTASNNAPRFDHDPATGASRGLLVEEARTNSIRNSQAGGSTNGAIGSGGAMPTNWTITSNVNNVTSEIVGTGTEDGLAYIDVKVSGTPTATSAVFINTDGVAQIVAANGQTWTAASYVKLAGGGTTNVSTLIACSGRLVGGGVAGGGNTTDTTFTPTSAALKSQRPVATSTFTLAAVERVLLYFGVIYASGQQIGGSADGITLRIAAPQLEQGAFPTSYIPTTTAAATRSADSAVVTPISSFYNQAEGTLFAEATTADLAAYRYLASFSNGTSLADRNFDMFKTASNLFAGAISVASALQAELVGGQTWSSSVNKSIMAARTDDVATSQNGAAVLTDTSATIPTNLDRLSIGCRPDGVLPLNGHIRKVAYYPRRLSNALLQQLTT